MPSEKQNTVKITKDDVQRKLNSIPDWKVAGPDKNQGFWLRFFAVVQWYKFQVGWLKEELFWC